MVEAKCGLYINKPENSAVPGCTCNLISTSALRLYEPFLKVQLSISSLFGGGTPAYAANLLADMRGVGLDPIHGRYATTHELHVLHSVQIYEQRRTY
jgi:hypothetical protein